MMMMTQINHVTYHLQNSGLKTIEGLMELLGFEEIEADDPFEHGYDVRWFRRTGSPTVHFVADGSMGDILQLGHFCVVLPRSRWESCRHSAYCVRDSGSGRIWLEHDAVRVEVRAG